VPRDTQRVLNNWHIRNILQKYKKNWSCKSFLRYTRAFCAIQINLRVLHANFVPTQYFVFTNTQNICIRKFILCSTKPFACTNMVVYNQHSMCYNIYSD